jgi:hypothetical protein
MFDFTLLMVAAICQLALGFLGLRVTTRRVKKEHRSRYELAFVIVGLIGLAAIVWSGLRSGIVQQGIADGVERIQARLGIVDSKHDQEAKIFIQCDFGILPKTMPASGEIFISEPHSSNPSLIGMGGIERQFAPAGSPIMWNPKDKDKDFPAFGYRCQLFNYGTSPIFDVTLTFNVSLLSVKTNDGGGKQSDKVVATDKIMVLIAKVDQGAENAFVFYFFNRFSPYFLQIDPTPSATFVRSNNSERQSLEVISSTHQPFFINPADINP